MAVFVSVLLLVMAATASAVLIAVAVRGDAAAGGITPRPVTMHDDPGPAGSGRVRLFTRLLFARRSFDAFTLDCILVSVDGDLPADIEPPLGLPFTIRVRCPDTSWFAGRVEELLSAWAAENRELIFELAPDRGRVRTIIASGESSVHLELAGAAGLGASGITDR